MVFAVGLMILALIANSIFDRDYMLLNHGSGSPLVGVLEYGQFAYTMAMIVGGLVAVGLISIIATTIYKLTHRG